MISCPGLALLLSACTVDPGGDEEADDSGETAVITTTLTTDGPPTTTGDGDGDDSATTIPGDGEGDSGDGDGDEGVDCGEVEITPTYVPPNVMMVVDASGSMVAQSWDHDLNPDTDDVTRWFSLHGVVDTVMSNFGAAMFAGVQRFPAEAACDPDPCYNITSCTVEGTPEVGIGPDNGAAVLAAIPSAGAGGDEIEGGTPAAAGVRSAIEHLLDQEGDRPNYILLVTDGAANCDTELPYPDFIEQYDETLPVTVEDAFMDQGITTFVVGIDIVDQLVGSGIDGSPEANPFERLNDVAVAGGAPKNDGLEQEKFFNATNEDELLGAIEQILGDVTSCVIELDPPPQEQQIPYVDFFLDGEEVPLVEDCLTEDGWVWNELGLVVEFCGSYCEGFKNGVSEFDGVYGCPIPD